MGELEFRPGPHEYWKDGRRIPGFHDEAHAVGLIHGTEHIPERYRIAGSNTHAAIHFALEGDLDEASVAPADMVLVRKALAYLAPWRERGCKIVAERPVYSELGYATCADTYWIEGTTLHVLDWKSKVRLPWYPLQLVATADAVRETIHREMRDAFVPTLNLRLVYLDHDPIIVEPVYEDQEQELRAEWGRCCEHYDWMVRNGIVRPKTVAVPEPETTVTDADLAEAQRLLREAQA